MRWPAIRIYQNLSNEKNLRLCIYIYVYTIYIFIFLITVTSGEEEKINKNEIKMKYFHEAICPRESKRIKENKKKSEKRIKAKINK